MPIQPKEFEDYIAKEYKRFCKYYCKKNKLNKFYIDTHKLIGIFREERRVVEEEDLCNYCQIRNFVNQINDEVFYESLHNV